MSEEAVIGREFVMVISKKVWRKLDLKEGQRALVREEAGRIIIEPLLSDPSTCKAEIQEFLSTGVDGLALVSKDYQESLQASPRLL